MNFKKLFHSGLIILCTLSVLLSLHATVFADPVNPDDLLPPPDIFSRDSGPDVGGAVRVPNGSFREAIMPALLKILLGIAGSVAFVTFTVAGIMLIVSQGNEELQTKVKNIFMYALAGLVVIALSYAIIYGVFTLQIGQQIGSP